MRQCRWKASRMAAAAFIAAAGAGQAIDSLDDRADTNDLTIAPGMANPTGLVNHGTPTNRAVKLARRWAKVAIMVEWPQAPIVQSRRNSAAKHQRLCGRQGDHRPQLRRGRFW